MRKNWEMIREMSTEVPKRDEVTPPADVTEPETEEAKKSGRQNWKEFKGVVDSSVIDTIDRLSIVAGVNEYKGNHYVFLGKVTEGDFQRAFFSMPAYAWKKAIPILTGYVDRIADIEKASMANAVLVELKRLKELGIDVTQLLEQLK